MAGCLDMLITYVCFVSWLQSFADLANGVGK